MRAAIRLLLTSGGRWLVESDESWSSTDWGPAVCSAAARPRAPARYNRSIAYGSGIRKRGSITFEGWSFPTQGHVRNGAGRRRGGVGSGVRASLCFPYDRRSRHAGGAVRAGHGVRAQRCSPEGRGRVCPGHLWPSQRYQRWYGGARRAPVVWKAARLWPGAVRRRRRLPSGGGCPAAARRRWLPTAATARRRAASHGGTAEVAAHGGDCSAAAQQQQRSGSSAAAATAAQQQLPSSSWPERARGESARPTARARGESAQRERAARERGEGARRERAARARG